MPNFTFTVGSLADTYTVVGSALAYPAELAWALSPTPEPPLAWTDYLTYEVTLRSVRILSHLVHHPKIPAVTHAQIALRMNQLWLWSTYDKPTVRTYLQRILDRIVIEVRQSNRIPPGELSTQGLLAALALCNHRDDILQALATANVRETRR